MQNLEGMKGVIRQWQHRMTERHRNLPKLLKGQSGGGGGNGWESVPREGDVWAVHWKMRNGIVGVGWGWVERAGKKERLF